MNIRCVVLLIVVTLFDVSSLAQLHLITGSASSKSPEGYPSSLLRIGADGSVENIAKLADGTYWLTVSYDWRLALVLPMSPDDQVRVLGFDKGSVVKVCTDPPGPFAGLMDQWLVDSPAAGPVFTEYLVGDDLTKGWLRGMILDPAVPCEKSFVKLDPTDTRFVVAHGYAGVSDITENDGMRIALGSDGRLSTFIGSVTGYLDAKVPTRLLSGMSRPFGGVAISDSKVLVMSVGDADDASSQRLLILRRRDKSWRRIPVPSEEISWARGFGNYIAISEAQFRNVLHPVSAGAAEWRRSSTASGRRGRVLQG